MIKRITFLISIFFSSIFLIVIALSFTTLPFWMYYNLGVDKSYLESDPDYIVVMSGNGIPSESGLMRTYFASKEANKYKKSKIIISMPGDTTDTTSACYLMKKELVLRKVNPGRILFENKGTNTRSQALAVREMLKGNPSILIVTSPEHVYRTKATFKKIGFSNIFSKAAHETPVEASFLFQDDDLGGNDLIIEIGESTQFRYQFWNHLKLQIVVFREYTAIVFYKMKGWI